jgi:hypothetical protein
MNGANNIFEWMLVLAVVLGLLFAFIRAGNYWHSRFHHPDPLMPEVQPNYEHRYSLRREK